MVDQTQSVNAFSWIKNSHKSNKVLMQNTEMKVGGGNLTKQEPNLPINSWHMLTLLLLITWGHIILFNKKVSDTFYVPTTMLNARNIKMVRHHL